MAHSLSARWAPRSCSHLTCVASRTPSAPCDAKVKCTLNGRSPVSDSVQYLHNKRTTIHMTEIYNRNRTFTMRVSTLCVSVTNLICFCLLYLGRTAYTTYARTHIHGPKPFESANFSYISIIIIKHKWRTFSLTKAHLIISAMPDRLNRVWWLVRLFPIT